MLARKDNQRLEPVNQPNGAGQSCVKGLPASALSSEPCTVQVLAGTQNLSALRNSEVSALQHFVLYNEVSAIENVC